MKQAPSRDWEIYTGSKGSKEKSKAKVNDKRVAELEPRLKQATQEYDLFQGHLYAKYPELQAQRARSPLIKVEEIAALIPDADTALLEYVMGHERSYLFVVTKPSTRGPAESRMVDLQIYPLSITRQELAALVNTFHRRISGHRDDYDEIGQQLYDLLIKPATQQISNKKTLGIVPDAALWNLPFDALQNGTRYLVQDHQTFLIPSLTVLREMRKRTIRIKQLRGSRLINEPTYLAFADPSLNSEISDPIAEGVRDKKFGPIPESRNEIRRPTKYFGSGRYGIYMGPEAREAYLKSRASQYNFIHLATHGVFDDFSPMSSFMLLAQGVDNGPEDGRLQAREMVDLDLQAAKLVVLSACETAKGRITGEGILGMTWTLFVAGSPVTLGSLWSVESKSTSQLMGAFYENFFDTQSPEMGRTPVRKAAALRQAELTLLKSVDYNYPYYWAGFVLVGDPH